MSKQRLPLIAANWKMNLLRPEAEKLVTSIVNNGPYNLEVAIAPPFPYLITAANIIDNKPGFFLAAQNCSNHDPGAFTGEVAANMLLDCKVSMVILGHSERRSIFNESDELINKKLITVLNHKLTPILCCGEDLEDRNANRHIEVVGHQLEHCLNGISARELPGLIIAYEPVWAIGTGLTAKPEQAQDMHAFIRSKLSELYPGELADNTRILYGGSVKPENAAELLACPDIDGALVGGASLKAADFTAILKAG